MKILIVHNDYGRYSGEEAVVDRMIGDFSSCGHQVETLRLTSEGFRNSLTGKIRGFFAGIYSIKGRRLMRHALRRFRPDVVNVHNLYPFISPAVLPICHRKGVRVIMTVHNYRLICPTGLFLRDGSPCENCLQNGNELDCIRYNCEHSMSRSIGFAMRNAVARWAGAYKDNVDLFCCLTEFQKSKLVAAGFDESKMKVIPNYTAMTAVAENTEHQDYNHSKDDAEGFVGYVGRLSHEKGCDLLIEVARRHPEMPFRMAGTLRDDKPVEVPENIVLCGQINREQLDGFYRQARFIVVPSRCYEGFPTVLLEAASHTKPCVVPAHGPFPELVTGSEGLQCGVTFTPLDIDDLEREIVKLWNDPLRCATIGQNALKNAQTRFSREAVVDAWKEILK